MLSCFSKNPPTLVLKTCTKRAWVLFRPVRTVPELLTLSCVDARVVLTLVLPVLCTRSSVFAVPYPWISSSGSEGLDFQPASRLPSFREGEVVVGKGAGCSRYRELLSWGHRWLVPRSPLPALALVSALSTLLLNHTFHPQERLGCCCLPPARLGSTGGGASRCSLAKPGPGSGNPNARAERTGTQLGAP